MPREGGFSLTSRVQGTGRVRRRLRGVRPSTLVQQRSGCHDAARAEDPTRYDLPSGTKVRLRPRTSGSQGKRRLRSSAAMALQRAGKGEPCRRDQGFSEKLPLGSGGLVSNPRLPMHRMWGEGHPPMAFGGD